MRETGQCVGYVVCARVCVCVFGVGGGGGGVVCGGGINEQQQSEKRVTVFTGDRSVSR